MKRVKLAGGLEIIESNSIPSNSIYITDGTYHYDGRTDWTVEEWMESYKNEIANHPNAKQAMEILNSKLYKALK